jgi:hypothetical protein
VPLAFRPISGGSGPSFILHASVVGTAEITADPFGLSTIYAATVPFITRATDTPANQPFEGTLAATLRIDRSIIEGDGFGGFSQNIGELQLINADGSYDDFADFSTINAQPVRLWIGTITGRDTVEPFSQFVQFSDLTGERMAVNRSSVLIEMTDPAQRLTSTPVSANVYAGTGDLEGGEDIKGRRRPRGFGVVFNATPVLVMASQLLWQFNDGAVASVQAVKDSGAMLTLRSNHASVAALLADAPNISPGQYGTCVAEGYFALGGANFGQVTVDFTGINVTTADIIEEVALAAGLAADDLDADSFSQINEDQPASVGYYLDWTGSETCGEMFTRLMRGIGGWWGMTPLGLLQVRRFDPPVEIASAYYDTSGGQVINVDRVSLPNGVDPPPHRRRVIYSRNWTAMTDIAGTISETDPDLAEFLRQEFKTATTSDDLSTEVKANYPHAPDPDPIEAFFVNEADAQTEAERLFELYTVGFGAYSVRLKNALFIHEIGQIINVTDSRIGLQSGKYLRIVSTVDDLSNMMTEVVGFG